MKKCACCKKEKPISEFSKSIKSKDKLRPHCKECAKQKFKNYYRSEKGVIDTIYKGQINSCKIRNHKLPTYTKMALKKWLYENNFKLLYNNWVDSDYNKDLKPSVDRLDDDYSYSFDNIRLVTWKENIDISRINCKKGKYKNKITPVIQMDLNGNYINEFISQQEAKRITKCTQSAIWNCCNGFYKYTNGFKWKYKN